MKKSTKEFLSLAVGSFLAGMMIAFGAMACIVCNSLAGDQVWTKLLGTVLFSFGLTMIVALGFKLFTGMIAFMLDMKPRKWWKLAVCYIFNTLGCAFVAVMIMPLGIYSTVAAGAAKLVATKLDNSLFTSFVSACGCGMMITLAVWSNKKAGEKSLSGSLCLIFPIVMFILFGFEHTIANQAYFFFAPPEISLKFVGFLLITILGNVLGGILIPLLLKVEKLKVKEDAEIKENGSVENGETARKE